MIIPMAAEVGSVLIILTAFVSSTISYSDFITLSPRNVEMVAGTWRENFTCTVKPRSTGRYRHVYLSSANLTLQFTPWSTRQEHAIPDTCTRLVNDTTLEMSYCPLVDEKRSTTGDWLACFFKHDKFEYAETRVTIKDRHEMPQILEPEVYNWDALSFLIETHENQVRMFNMSYKAWFWNNSTKSAARECRIERINATVLKATVERPFQVSHPNDNLIIKVEGLAKGEKTKKIIETVSSDEESIILNQFVKPAQVNNIEVLQLESSVTLSFEPPKLNRNITYNVLVECDKDSNNHSVNVTREINCPPNNETRQSDNNIGTNCRVSKEFTDLPAFSSCTASVRAVPVAGGRWSDWKRHDFETPERVPRRNPEICSNCFSIRQGISDSVSDVIVYFTPLSEEEAQGKIILHRIRILDKSSSNESFQYLNNTENNHYSFILRNLSHHYDYEIGIEAKTSKGYYSGSPNTSKAIGVPLSHVRSISYPKNFVVVLVNYTAVRASWYLDESVCGSNVKISLFWCEGHFRNKTCTNVLKRKSISSAVTSDIIAFSGGQFIFGIGVECDGKSSGILWNACVYDIDKNPLKPDIHTIVPFDSGATIVLGNNSECSPSGRGQGLTVAYRISYCQILLDVSNIGGDCAGSWTTLTLDRSHENSLTVNGLDQNHRYRLSIRSLSENNKSSQEVNRFIELFPVAKPISGNGSSSSSYESYVLIPAALATRAVLITIVAVVYCLCSRW